MTLKHFNIIKKSFVLNKTAINKITKNKKLNLEEFNWDSITIINLLTILSDDYKVNVEPKVLQKIKTFEELDNFLSRKITKK